MSARVNLLPAAFVQRRRLRQRRRAWIAMCITLAASQGVIALVVSQRGREVGQYRAQAAKLNAALKQEKAERDMLRAKADVIARDTALAERLREKHCWSRWLGNLSLMVPGHVMLTNVETDPAQFGGNESVAANVARGVNAPAKANNPRLVRLRGAAARHEDLMALVKAMNGLTWFHSVQLEEAKREKIAEHEAIGFALACDW